MKWSLTLETTFHLIDLVIYTAWLTSWFVSQLTAPGITQNCYVKFHWNFSCFDFFPYSPISSSWTNLGFILNVSFPRNTSIVFYLITLLFFFLPPVFPAYTLNVSVFIKPHQYSFHRLDCPTLGLSKLTSHLWGHFYRTPLLQFVLSFTLKRQHSGYHRLSF